MPMTPEQILESARAGDLDRLGVEREDVAKAAHSFVTVGDAALALELVGRTWRIWSSRGELNEGRSVVRAALATPGASAVPIWEARVLYADGLFAFRAGDQQQSRASNEKALRVAHETGDVRGECDAMTGLARVELRDGRYSEVVALASRARELARVERDREAEAAPLHLLAAGTRLQRDYPAARDLYLESLHLSTGLGKTEWVAMELHNLGWVELHLGNVAEAAARFNERDAATGADAYSEAWKELNWSAIAAAHGDVAEAGRRLAIGTGALERLAVTLDPDDASELDWLREQIGPTDRLQTPPDKF